MVSLHLGKSWMKLDKSNSCGNIKVVSCSTPLSEGEGLGVRIETLNYNKKSSSSCEPAKNHLIIGLLISFWMWGISSA